MDPRILITNDDGVHSEGLDVLATLAGQLSDDVWIVAPDSERSGASHSVSLADPLRVRQLGPKKFAVRGSPTDCVVLGVKHLCADRRPTVILSGVNRGANVADDVLYSGTIAAAREGLQFGIPSIALSQILMRGQPTPWHTAAKHGATLLPRLLALCTTSDMLLNVNFPPLEPDAVRGILVTRQGKRTRQEIAVQERIDNRGFPYYWLSFDHDVVNPEAGTDLAAIAQGCISVTPLQLDMTHHARVEQIAASLAPAA